jgi:hypothetical protein
LAKGNNEPSQLLSLRSSMEELGNMALQCGLINSCAELAWNRTSGIGGGWDESYELTSYGNREVGCQFSGEIYLRNGEASIRGIIGRSGRLNYSLPPVACAPADLDISRRVTVTEAGILFVDFTMEVPNFPGQWIMGQKLRTPQTQVAPNGNLRIVMANNHFFEIEPSQGRIIDSDLFDPVMFDPGVCRTEIRNRGTQALTDIHMRPGARRHFGPRFTDLGGMRTEQAIDRHLRSTERQPL